MIFCCSDSIYLLIKLADVAITSLPTSCRRVRILTARLSEIDKKDGFDFEKRMFFHFQKVGWDVKITPRSGDHGADIVGREPSGVCVVIQAERWNYKVGASSVEEVIRAREYYGAKRMIVITNNYLTPKAKRIAESACVKFWERNRLIDELAIVNKQRSRELTPMHS
ncbi:hypothetical protein DNHGIG_00520 [Collibacillus ludicampi]|uniref:Restriction endonuclease type IV Mrr domain-containing protein n=1 Tax=Collibacillus ludicampi TaxID=2771369 RepID=A0AAV4L9Y7_9BACL|nr:restriction endonuclease [Collibacillus ludicampi]GIM44503.1 hypothetical protein DNHGIG_00520 [Collibacillus ludicampi]